MNSPISPFTSAFEKTYDVVVCGAGLIGYAAARRLASEGKEVLLLEPSSKLLWEATLALENCAGGADAPSWTEWLASQEQEEICKEWFDPASAEISTAYMLSGRMPRITTLLYVTPQAVEISGGKIQSVTLATKSGQRTIRARHWIDATENGTLAQIANPCLLARSPKATFRSVVIQTLQPDLLDRAVLSQSDFHVDYLSSHRATERRIRWLEEGAWYREVVRWIRKLRAVAADSGASFGVSHLSLAGYPVYDAEPGMEATVSQGNLTVLSPIYRIERLYTPADRFLLGNSVTIATGAPLAKPLSPIREETADYDVVIAGAGTSGALAAIAAGRSGVRTLVFDPATYPGGMGTGGGICSYFYGTSDGLQKEIDERVCKISELLSGKEQKTEDAWWHPDSKKIVLLECFEEAGVEFLENTHLWNIEKNGERVTALQTITNGQMKRLSALGFIDATGDGDLCVMAGAEYTIGRPGDGGLLAFSQSATLLKPDDLAIWMTNFDAGCVDPTDPEDFSRARLQGIAQYYEPMLRKECIPVTVAPMIGLRQSRQIRTDVEVSFTDTIMHARFDDAIGRYDCIADTHSVDLEFESDEMVFYYWTCQSHHHHIACELPYRMLLPVNLENVWVPCRAAGMTHDASYGLRMQRHLQRLGEVAGRAAALAAKTENGVSRKVNLPALQSSLQQNKYTVPDLDYNDPLAALDRGVAGVHLWYLYKHPDRYREALIDRLSSSGPVSFLAAAVLSMWREPSAEARLIQALDQRETGPVSDGRWFSVPFWYQALMLLRINGTDRVLQSLFRLAQEPGLLLNIRTAIALTLEQIARRLGNVPPLVETMELLLATEIPDPVLPPTRSLWLKLDGEVYNGRANFCGADTTSDQTWQVHLVIARAKKILGLPVPPSPFLQDPRASVRAAFQKLG